MSFEAGILSFEAGTCASRLRFEPQDLDLSYMSGFGCEVVRGAAAPKGPMTYAVLVSV